MDFDVFVQTVRQQQPYNEKWDHILPAVPEQYRERFLTAIKQGINMPRSYDLVLVTTGMTDKDFYRKLGEIST